MMPTQLNTSSGSALCAGDMGAVELAVHLIWFVNCRGIVLIDGWMGPC